MYLNFKIKYFTFSRKSFLWSDHQSRAQITLFIFRRLRHECNDHLGNLLSVRISPIYKVWFVNNDTLSTLPIMLVQERCVVLAGAYLYTMQTHRRKCKRSIYRKRRCIRHALVNHWSATQTSIRHPVTFITIVSRQPVTRPAYTCHPPPDTRHSLVNTHSHLVLRCLHLHICITHRQVLWDCSGCSQFIFNLKF